MNIDISPPTSLLSIMHITFSITRMIDSNGGLLFNIWLYLILFAFLWGIAVMAFIGVLKIWFSKFDEVLLKEPYFNSAEQENYQHFPLSFHKTIIYIHLFSFKKAVRKRFKDMPDIEPSKLVRNMSYTAAVAIYLQIASTLTFILLMPLLAN